jgi:hypothetical protein
LSFLTNLIAGLQIESKGPSFVPKVGSNDGQVKIVNQNSNLSRKLDPTYKLLDSKNGLFGFFGPFSAQL